MDPIYFEQNATDCQRRNHWCLLPDAPQYEKRYFPRWPTTHRAYYRIKNVQAVFRTKIKDLTPEGVCLFVSSDVSESQKLELKIYVSGQESFEGEGTVIWKKILPNQRYYAGIRFDRISQETQNLILEHAGKPGNSVPIFGGKFCEG